MPPRPILLTAAWRTIGCPPNPTVVHWTRSPRSSPSAGLLIGLLVTLVAVVADGWYVSRQISGLQALQTGLTDRNRKDSLQLLRIQNDLNVLGLAMRDILDNEEPYPLTAWSAQFARIRTDLDDALRLEATVATASRTPEQQQYLSDSVVRFWNAADRIFATARDGREDEARTEVRLSLQARQSALGTAVARLLVQNNASEEETAARVQGIYRDVRSQVIWFVAAMLGAIILTSLYVIRSNRRLFVELARLSDDRHELAQQLIAARESTLRDIARELHDELGQVLTAIGSMVGRAARQMSVGSPVQADLREVCEIAQTALDSVRGLSQSLHPSALEQIGLAATIDEYVSTMRRQTGLEITYERSGPPRPVAGGVAIQVYRVLQEALSNVVRHAATGRVWVRLRLAETAVELEVEDHGHGIAPDTPRRGLGLVGMRERAALVGGTVVFETPESGGTRVRLRVPLEPWAERRELTIRAG